MSDERVLPVDRSLRAFRFEAWHEDDHDVLWWHFPICEAPYVGSPLCSDWPFDQVARHELGWTRLAVPAGREP